MEEVAELIFNTEEHHTGAQQGGTVRNVITHY